MLEFSIVYISDCGDTRLFCRRSITNTPFFAQKLCLLASLSEKGISLMINCYNLIVDCLLNTVCPSFMRLFHDLFAVKRLNLSLIIRNLTSRSGVSIGLFEYSEKSCVWRNPSRLITIVDWGWAKIDWSLLMGLIDQCGFDWGGLDLCGVDLCEVDLCGFDWRWSLFAQGLLDFFTTYSP